MSALFLNILNLAINASWLIVAVIVARLLLKKAPKWISCLLWGLVAIRLLCPVSLESALSLLPSAKVVPGNIEMVQDPHIDSGVRIIDNAVNPVIERSLSPDVASSANPMQVVVFVASVIWLIGMAAMLMYALISFFLLKRKVRASAVLRGRVQECDEVDSPFILGVFRPVIYVPSGINEKTLELVIAHEEAHLKRHDHWWKPLGFVLLAVYWFNPLCWVAYILLCRDIETACDEKVIRDKDRDYLAAYSQAMLDCSVNRRIIAACPLAFGETGVKERVKGVLNYKKTAFWVIIVAVIACIAIGVCFLTNPLSTKADDELMQFLEKAVLDHSESGQHEGFFHCCDIEVLGIKTDSETKTVYALVLEEEYIYNDGTPEDVSGSHGPTVFRVTKKDTGYTMSEYWIPQDGSYYVSSIHSKFPLTLWNKAVDSQRYIEQQKAHCMEKARQYFQSSGETENIVIQYYPLFSPEGLSGAVDFAPEDIHDIISADLWIAGPVLPSELGLSDGQSYRLHCDNPGIISELEKLLSEADKESGQSGCPFYTALYLTRSDGTVGTVFPATDSCAMYLSGRECYKYSEGTNEALWRLIGEFNLVNHSLSTEADNSIGLIMTAESIAPTGCKLVFTQNGGNVTGELETGQWYELQVKNGNGEWIDNSSKDTERSWKDIAYTVKMNGITELTVNWEQDYGYLQSGHYRIVKKVMDYRSPGYYDEYEIYAEFDIRNGILGFAR